MDMTIKYVHKSLASSLKPSCQLITLSSACADYTITLKISPASKHWKIKHRWNEYR